MMPTAGQSLQFNCPQCVASLKAPLALAGTRSRCPRCQFVFEVPRQTRRAPPGEGYALHQDAGPSSADPAVYVPVLCSVCHTRMYGAVEQIGQTLICPDCGTPAVVQPPAALAKPIAPPVIGQTDLSAAETYPLCEEVASTPGAHRAADEVLIRVMCPRCNTMMYATEDQVGGSQMCPDCHTSVVIPRPPPPRERIDVMADAGEGYKLADWDQAGQAPAVPQPPPPPPKIGKPRVPPRARRYFEPYFLRPRLPRRPFLTGTFSFPFSSGARAYALLLAAWATAAAWLAVESIELAGSFDGRELFLSAMFGAIAGIMALMLYAFAAACALAVVRDTANGCDNIQAWPDLAFIDWFSELLYPFNGLCASLAPGFGLAWVLVQYDQPGEAAAPASVFFLFPLMILSMLETGTPLGAVSWPVCRTLWQAWRGWAAFYLTTAGLLAVPSIVVVEALLTDWAVGVVVAAPILSVVWLIYFRLLGRLAWYCTDRTREKDELDS